jgi:hypothetical protein
MYLSGRLLRHVSPSIHFGICNHREIVVGVGLNNIVPVGFWNSMQAIVEKWYFHGTKLND